jgi:hypothetical protein
LTITLDQHWPGKDHSIGKFRISTTTAKTPVSLTGPPEAIAKILNVPAETRNNEQNAELTKYFRSIDAQLAQLVQAVKQHPKPADKRLLGAQDLAWALTNSPAFLFNH